MTTLEAPAPVEETRHAVTRRMTYAEFHAWAGEDTRAEWVDGEVIVFTPAKQIHQNMVGFLHLLLGAFVRLFDLGKVIVAPFELRLRPEGNAREPDVMFIANEHLDRLTPERMNGAPDLIIEVVSDESVHRDRVDKFDEYEAGGVREYWIIDYRAGRPRRADFYQPDRTGHYQRVTVDDDGLYLSAALPGFWINVNDLLADDPDWLKALGRLVGPERLTDILRSALGG
jgi:Uma2 family endonuclease